MRIFFTKRIVNISILFVFFSVLVYAFETGITGRTMKSGIGCTCHDLNPSTNVIVNINGPDTLAPNQTANYSLTMTGGPLVRGGTDIAASAGQLNIVSNDLQILGNELTHTAPKLPSNGTVTFQFTYTAPSAPGAETLFATGNSVNFNSDNSGDQWNFAPNKSINVMTPTSIEDENIISLYKLEQNYPNPFNPSTEINFTISQSAQVKLIIYNSIGDEITTLVDGFKNKGSYSINFNSNIAKENIPSGVYFYKLQAGNFQQTKKMLLLK